MKVQIEADPDSIIQRGLMEGMRAFNQAAIPGLASKSAIVTIRDDDGTLMGGAIGRIAMDSMYVEIVWNSDAVRGTGKGREMMLMLEDEARKLGATESWLYTMSFQAKPFYEKLGYSQFAELPWNSGQHHRHFMRKDL
ncbi:MAG: GNAT family N-acetyltransferase [Alphaproteobacteria bacterium]|nr:GNAT family N-acetyltransferase [Alphaproteobacteria bacterium]